jgi:hypothetical protein
MEAELLDEIEPGRQPSFLRRHWLATSVLVVVLGLSCAAGYVVSHQQHDRWCTGAGTIYEPEGSTPQDAIAAWLSSSQGGHQPVADASSWHRWSRPGSDAYSDGSGQYLEVVHRADGPWQVIGYGHC